MFSFYAGYFRAFVFIKQATFQDSLMTQWRDKTSNVNVNVNMDAYGKSNDGVFGWFEEHRGSVCVCVLAVYRAGLFIHCGASHTMNQAILLPSTSSLQVNRSYQ